MFGKGYFTRVSNVLPHGQVVPQGTVRFVASVARLINFKHKQDFDLKIKAKNILCIAKDVEKSIADSGADQVSLLHVENTNI